jgi:nicotinamide mononucleotide (NMN) deamidase PncC
MQRGGRAQAERLQLGGDRASVRAQTVVLALQRLSTLCSA